MSLPPYAVDFRGRPCCPCQAAWLPVFEAELQRRHLIVGELSIAQLIGGAPQSGGTHSMGGASDFWPRGLVEETVALARQMGADATWHRPFNWDGKNGTEHIHSVLRGCVHNGPARYQYDSPTSGVDHGKNGLANHGDDDGPRPLSGRTWREGIEWAKEQDVTPEQQAQLDRIEAKLDDLDKVLKRITKSKREVLAAVEDES